MVIYNSFFKLVTHQPSVDGLPIARILTPSSGVREEYISIENELPEQSTERRKKQEEEELSFDEI